MNYRHGYHAGNFADVLKHALLLRVLRLMQKKEAGLLYVDTHAGRGCYDLREAARGGTLERKPEWPEGIGRLIARVPDAGGAGAGPGADALDDYLALVRQFDREQGNGEEGLRYYPGSPDLVRMAARAQDRMDLWERHPEECEVLRIRHERRAGVAVHEADGYGAVRACLPPAERRALVLIDPPYEKPEEGNAVVRALSEGLERLPSGVVCIWYPLTQRAGAGGMGDAVRVAVRGAGRTALAVELMPDPPSPGLCGCGLLVVNPPWTLEGEAAGLLGRLGESLRQGPAARHSLEWVVREEGTCPPRGDVHPKRV